VRFSFSFNKRHDQSVLPLLLVEDDRFGSPSPFEGMAHARLVVVPSWDDARRTNDGATVESEPY
jgi:hypothetical protein